VSWLVVLVLVRTGRQREKLRGPTDQTSRSEVSLEMLCKIVGPTKVLAACFHRTLVWTFLGVSAIVTLEVLHAFEALATVADVKLVS